MEPFSKLTSYSSFAYINKENLKYLSERLRQIGFDNQEILLPNIIIKEKEVTEGPENKKFPIDAFLKLDQGFDPILFTARNTDGSEEISLLLKNKSVTSVSFDNPSFRLVKENRLRTLFVSTMDPIRTYGLLNFIQDYLKGTARNVFVSWLLLMSVGICLSLLVIYIIVVASSKSISHTTDEAWPYISIAIFVLVLSLLMPKSGLDLGSRKWILPDSVLELKKHSLIITVTFLAGLLAIYIAHLFGWT